MASSRIERLHASTGFDDEKNNLQGPSSSVPLPWSSSPSEHLKPASPSKLNQAAKVLFLKCVGVIFALIYLLVKKRPSEETLANVPKRRALPWLSQQEPVSHTASTQFSQTVRQTTTSKSFSLLATPKSVPPHVEQILDRQKQKAWSTQPQPAQTPQASSKSPYPWNKTASAVKEEQKRLRTSNPQKARLMKRIESTEGEIAEQKQQSKKNNPAKVFLSDEQQKVLKLVVEEGKSVFFTGPAGVGKSVLLRNIIKALRQKYAKEPDRVAVTASTGLAACNVGGVTLHSFAGIGLGKEAAPELVKKIKKQPKNKNRWLRTKVLIIDEISMVDGELFDKLEEIARHLRNNGRPFGGIRLVITGDFFQLPPVPDRSSRASKFAFEGSTWPTCIDHTIGLTQVFRQKDPTFAGMLNEMRLGRLSSRSISAFKQLSRPLHHDDDLEATELFPTRREVEAANAARMKNLGGSAVDYIALDGGHMTDPIIREKMLEHGIAPQKITLKKGAQVMLIKNIDESLVNGSLGKVIAFMDEKTFDIYHEDEDEFQELENMDLSNPESLPKTSKLKSMMVNTNTTAPKWPLVRFHIADGTTRDLLCQRETWKNELPNGEVQVSREQVPLILAWALSIHKAQGQTLERVKVDCGKIFEKGQAYVALSRATCQEGLQILRFDASKVQAHHKVRSFYDSLYSVDIAGGKSNGFEPPPAPFKDKPEVFYPSLPTYSVETSRSKATPTYPKLPDVRQSSTMTKPTSMPGGVTKPSLPPKLEARATPPLSSSSYTKPVFDVDDEDEFGSFSDDEAAMAEMARQGY